MQVFKAYFTIIRRKIVSVGMYFVIFVGIAIALNTLGGEEEAGKFMRTSLVIAVQNLDEGELGEAFLDYLAANNELVEVPETEDEVLDAIFCRKYDYVLYIPKDFTARFLAGERKELLTNRKVPSSISGMYADSQMEGYLRTIGMYVNGGFSLEESIAYTKENLSMTAEVAFADRTDAAEPSAAGFYLQYLAYIFICTVVMLVGPVLLIFQKKDIYARNKCSANSFFSRNVQLMGASLLIMGIEYVLLMVIACILYPNDMLSGRGVLAGINAFLMILITVAIAYLAAQIVKNEEALNAVSNVLGLGFAFLGGVFVPLDMFSDALLNVSKFTPTYWYVTANTRINTMTDASGVAPQVWQAFVIEGIFAVALLAVGMMVNRMKARE